MKIIFLLGTARSGTTFLGRTALSHANELCYWGEPNHVWMHGHAYRRHDKLTAADASEPVKRYIRERFAERLEASGAKVLLEKTPANCLRLPFIREVFPEARFIYLRRDGRSVVRSAMKEWRGQGGDARDSRELREGGSVARVGKGARAYLKLRERVHNIRDLMELPAYAPRFGRFVLRNCFPGKDFLWGPRFDGIQAYRRQHGLAATCAEQWRQQVVGIEEHKQAISSECVYDLRFENLMSDPASELAQLLNWMPIDMDATVLQSIADSVDLRPESERKDPLRGLTDLERRKVEAILEQTQQDLGYS